jgi:hypothetical protein
VPAFEYIVLKPLKIGDRFLEPGEVTVEPNTWSARTLKVYLTEQYLQPGQSIPEEFEQHRVLTHLPDQPAPAVSRKSAELRFAQSRGWRCHNCRKLCFLPDDLPERAEWQCWFSDQQQTVASIADQQDPTNVSEELYRRGLAKGDPTDQQQFREVRGMESLSTHEAVC